MASVNVPIERLDAAAARTLSQRGRTVVVIDTPGDHRARQVGGRRCWEAGGRREGGKAAARGVSCRRLCAQSRLLTPPPPPLCPWRCRRAYA